MSNQNVLKTGGIFAILVGISYLLVGITFFLQPSELVVGSVEEHLSKLYEDSTIRTLYFLAWAFTGIFALGAVPIITDLFSQYNKGLVMWIRNLAILGYAITIIANLRAMTIKPIMADVYVNENPMFQEIIPIIDPWLLLDPKGFISVGMVGLWLLVLNILSFKDQKFPLILNIIGILGALSLFIGVIGSANPILSGIASGVGGMALGPAWFIWMGLIMLRDKKNQQIIENDALNREVS